MKTVYTAGCFPRLHVHVNHSLNADSDSAGLRWGPGFCISNRLPSDSRAAGLGTTLRSRAQPHCCPSETTSVCYRHSKDTAACSCWCLSPNALLTPNLFPSHAGIGTGKDLGLKGIGTGKDLGVKGIGTGRDLGVKGIGTGNDLGLKGIGTGRDLGLNTSPATHQLAGLGPGSQPRAALASSPVT